MNFDAALAVGEDARAAAEGFDDDAGGPFCQAVRLARVRRVGDAEVKIPGGERTTMVAPAAMKARMPPA